MSPRVLFGLVAGMAGACALAGGFAAQISPNKRHQSDLLPEAEVPKNSQAPVAPTIYDCGTLALYTLMRLEGRPVELKTLETRLPALSPRGYSLKDLRDAARSFKLPLTGVQLAKSRQQPDRPMLVFLDRRPHGHFVVIRPVGHTGRLVQVLDSSTDPDVVDAANLYRSREWTGLALIPSRPN